MNDDWRCCRGVSLLEQQGGVLEQFNSRPEQVLERFNSSQAAVLAQVF